MTLTGIPLPSCILLVDKSAGMTSHDVVRKLRRLLGIKRIGHAGTLDPMATGLLIMGIGQGTKLLPYLMAHKKTYQAQVRLGMETDTLDSEGEPVQHGPVPPLSTRRIAEVLASFTGKISQEPPVFSALKRDGVALYKRARRGEKIEVSSREVEAFALAARLLDPSTLECELVVGQGFYVRSFARDIGRALGTFGHLAMLRRTRSGIFDVSQALNLRALEADAAAWTSAKAALTARTIALGAACAGLAEVVLSGQGVLDAQHGKLLGMEACQEGSWGEIPEHVPLALFGPGRALVAIAERKANCIKVRRGFSPEALAGLKQGTVSF
ncbi:MAG: tRNA pseudouridine(55) synthase TruB [Myxococcales bacterium]|nr:tRNA pseudouridine(55) synthase TruB [Myxococcales bacterium]